MHADPTIKHSIKEAKLRVRKETKSRDVTMTPHFVNNNVREGSLQSNNTDCTGFN
jgi:hypothetical protein